MASLSWANRSGEACPTLAGSGRKSNGGERKKRGDRGDRGDRGGIETHR